jgi:hypothetical protein
MISSVGSSIEVLGIRHWIDMQTVLPMLGGVQMVRANVTDASRFKLMLSCNCLAMQATLCSDTFCRGLPALSFNLMPASG